MNFISSLKATILGLIAAVTTAVAPVAPAGPVQNPPINIASPAASVQNQVQVNDQDNNYDIRGTYSYFGQSIKYQVAIPKSGGAFSGSTEGACQAALEGNYMENTGRVSGKAFGKCAVLFVKYEGAINFNGDLFPAEKKLVIQLEGARLSPITLNYN